MTKVKIEFFKHTGKWYTSFEFETNLPAHQLLEIKQLAEKRKEFIRGMTFTVEADQEGAGWNKYLFFN